MADITKQKLMLEPTAKCTLIVCNLEGSPNVVEATADKKKLIEGSSYFSGVFSFMESNTLKIKVPCPQNLVNCILPALDYSSPVIINTENFIETMRNARYLGLPNIYHSAIEVFLANKDAILNKEEFNYSNIKCVDVHYLFNSVKMISAFQNFTLEQQLIWKLEILLALVDGYENAIVEIKGLLEQYIDFTCCNYNEELSHSLQMLRKKYPIRLFQYVPFESVLDLIERNHSNEYVIVSGAGHLDANGEYFDSGMKHAGVPVYVLKRKATNYVLIRTSCEIWRIKSCLDISQLEYIIKNFYYTRGKYVNRQRHEPEIPETGWKCEKNDLAPAPTIKLMRFQ